MGFRPFSKRNIFVFASLALLASLLFVSSAWAIETQGGQNVTIDADEVIEDDLYVGAETVTVEGTVRGDLVAAGGTVRMNGTVEGDIISAGQTVIVNGTVEDDVRIAGQALLIGEDAQITDDLIAAGYSLESERGSTVGGELLYGGYQALVAGNVGENVRGGMTAFELSGEVAGNVEVGVDGGGAQPAGGRFAPGAPAVSVPSVEPGLTLTDTARVEGDLRYESSSRGDIASGAQIGGDVAYEQRPAEEGQPAQTGASAVLVESLRRFVVLILIGLLLVWLAPGLVRGVADTVRNQPLLSLGWGVLDYVIVVVAGLLVLAATILLAVAFGLITLGGLIPAIISIGVLIDAVLVVAFLISVFYLAPVVVGFLGGRMLLGRFQPDRASGRVLPLVIGIVLYVILRAIPILGVVVAVVVVLLGLGALSIWAWRTVRAGGTPPPPLGSE
ncbi:MAG: polymer-forming cytoskeletal protein [Actinomycetota bacterium]|nr:polymer-forming cytoskeletal protein [Actinomycetota bacterium]